MKTWVIAVVAVGVMALAALPALAVSLASNDDTGRERVSHSQDHDQHRADAGGAEAGQGRQGAGSARRVRAPPGGR